VVRSQVLRIAVISVATELWGSEHSILSVRPFLEDAGIELTLAAPPGPFAERWCSEGGRFTELRLPLHRGVVDNLGHRRLANVVSEVPQVLRGARAIKSVTAGHDVVHSNSLLANMDCGLARRMGGLPTVLEIHDLVRPGISRGLLSASLLLADAGVAISTAVAGNVDSLARGRIRLVPQAVDTTKFQPRAADSSVRRELTAYPGEPVVAVVGRLDPSKNVPSVVAALAELIGHEAHGSLAVIGSPSLGNERYADEVTTAARALLGDRVRFMPSQSDVPRLLSAIDVLVNASSAEPFGLSLLEAQSCGVAVIAANTGGPPDFITSGQTGLLYEPADPKSLTSTLGRLLADETLRRRLGAAGRAQAAAKFSLARRSDSLARVYREVATKMDPNRK
jgi:glycosyltransferase involved in cell wall biosynthesis